MFNRQIGTRFALTAIGLTGISVTALVFGIQSHREGLVVEEASATAHSSTLKSTEEVASASIQKARQVQTPTDESLRNGCAANQGGGVTYSDYRRGFVDSDDPRTGTSPEDAIDRKRSTPGHRLRGLELAFEERSRVADGQRATAEYVVRDTTGKYLGSYELRRGERGRWVITSEQLCYDMPTGKVQFSNQLPGPVTTKPEDDS